MGTVTSSSVSSVPSTFARADRSPSRRRWATAGWSRSVTVVPASPHFFGDRFIGTLHGRLRSTAVEQCVRQHDQHAHAQWTVVLDLGQRPFQQTGDFVGNLGLHHEAVRIVLAELAHACQPRQHARRFIPVERCLLVIPDRQVLVAADLAGVHQEVPRAVHGLEAHLLVLALDEEHVLAIVLPVARRLPQRLVEDDRRLDLRVAGRNQHAAHVVGERVVDA